MKDSVNYLENDTVKAYIAEINRIGNMLLSSNYLSNDTDIYRTISQFVKISSVFYSTLFESIDNHQRLVDAIADKSVEYYSQGTLATACERCQTWVSAAIRRLNVENVCIIKATKSTPYRINYENIRTNGVFSKILGLVFLFESGRNDLLTTTDKAIAEEFKLNITTVHMFKTYLRFACDKMIEVVNNHKLSE